MSWLKLEDTFCDHPKLVKLARRLGVSRVQARGHVVSLWCRVLGQSPDGHLMSRDCPGTVEDIEINADWDGEQGAFFDACVSVGLIDFDGETAGIHGWMERAGSLAEARKKAKQRADKKALSSCTEESEDTACPGTVPGQSENVPSQRRGEERRGELEECAPQGADAPTRAPRKKFSPPTQDETTALFQELGSTEHEASKYLAYYESNGWRVGRVAMKDWRAAARGWVAKARDYGPAGPRNGGGKVLTLSDRGLELDRLREEGRL